MRVVIAKAARTDLKIIARYTRKMWGDDQRVRYLADIRLKFDMLEKRPRLGSVRPDSGSNYRALAVGRHVIYYRLLSEKIDIVRVLHQSMDAAVHLSGQEG